MQNLVPFSVVLPLAAAIVLPYETPECSTFAKSLDLNSYNATLLNATYYPTHSLNVSNAFNNISFCEIYTSVSYGSGNNTLIAATWLPDRLQYNDRFMAVGNGGMAGTIDYAGMLTQLNSGMGFAVAGGDAGHRASDNNGGSGEAGVYLPYLHDKEQINAWIHDAISLFTPAAKALTAAYYGKDASHSFYAGCSTGGAQGMALAQYHPDLFDGIVAGCPGNWYSHLALSFLWNAQHTAVRDPPTRNPSHNLTDITPDQRKQTLPIQTQPHHARRPQRLRPARRCLRPRPRKPPLLHLRHLHSRLQLHNLLKHLNLPHRPRTRRRQSHLRRPSKLPNQSPTLPRLHPRL